MLGLSDEEFFNLTPRQLHILLDRHQQMIEHDEFMLAQICSTVANWSLGSPKEPLKAVDFMPSQVGKTPYVEALDMGKVNKEAATDRTRQFFMKEVERSQGKKILGKRLDGK